MNRCPAIHPQTKDQCQIMLENHGRLPRHYAKVAVLFNFKQDLYWDSLYWDDPMIKSDKILDTLTGRILKLADLLPAQLYDIHPDGDNYRYQPYEPEAKVQAVPTKEKTVFEAELNGGQVRHRFMVTSSREGIVFVDSSGSFYGATQIKLGSVKILLLP